jgi:hypothetical protein
MMGWWNKIAQRKKKEEAKEETNLTKEEATKQKKPWVNVLQTHVDSKNPRNGFFELDWNNEFVESLLDAGYSGETQEQIVDAWFKDLARNILKEEGINEDRGAGFINVKPIDKDKAEIS